MRNSFAEELYSESLKLSKMELDPIASAKSEHLDSQDFGDDFGCEDGSLWHDSDHELERVSDLEREWQRRHDQFHTIGYRDGLLAGKEAAAQEGFNIGFKQSVVDGYNWGLVRGVTSVLTSLPDVLKERLIETHEKRSEFQNLHDSMHSISTIDALRRFSDSIIEKEAAEEGVNAEVSSKIEGIQEQSSDRDHLGKYSGELQSLLIQTPSIKVQFL